MFAYREAMASAHSRRFDMSFIIQVLDTDTDITHYVGIFDDLNDTRESVGSDVVVTIHGVMAAKRAAAAAAAAPRVFVTKGSSGKHYVRKGQDVHNSVLMVTTESSRWAHRIKEMLIEDGV
jgi:hypothetical protein